MVLNKVLTCKRYQYFCELYSVHQTIDSINDNTQIVLPTK